MTRILVVDDDPAIRNGLCELIELLGAERVGAGRLCVEAAVSGEDAVARAAAEPVPALIIMDVSLPGIDGVEAFFRIVAARPESPPLTVFLTGYGGSGPLHRRLLEALQAGAHSVVSKPITAAALAEYIDLAVAPAERATASGDGGE